MHSIKTSHNIKRSHRALQSQITISFRLIAFIVMMIKKYAGVFLNLRVAVIYKKYYPKKITLIKR